MGHTIPTITIDPTGTYPVRVHCGIENGVSVPSAIPFPKYGSEFAVPPRFVVNEPCALEVRMASTKGQQNAWWNATGRANQAVNGAPYQPMFRGIVSGFRWEPADTKDCPSQLSEGEMGNHEIVQGGSGILNWSANVIAPLADHGAAILSALNRLVGLGEFSSEKVLAQSDLSVAVLEPAPGCDRARRYLDRIGPELRLGSRSRWIGDHCIYRHHGFMCRVANGTIYAIVRANADTVIMSPNAPDDTIGAELWGASGESLLLIQHTFTESSHG